MCVRAHCEQLHVLAYIFVLEAIYIQTRTRCDKLEGEVGALRDLTWMGTGSPFGRSDID